jgi:hypothetical protein
MRARLKGAAAKKPRPLPLLRTPKARFLAASLNVGNEARSSHRVSVHKRSRLVLESAKPMGYVVMVEKGGG